jgi:hypothetical protein
MVHFLPLPVRELTAEDVRLLVKLTRFWYGGQDAARLLAAADEGKMMFWRVEGDVQGLLLTEIKTWKSGRILWVQGFAGKGFAKHIQEVLKELDLLARAFCCKSFCWTSERPGMLRLAQSLGFAPRCYTFEKECSDV